jgi:hypothetical protein
MSLANFYTDADTKSYAASKTSSHAATAPVVRPASSNPYEGCQEVSLSE